MKMRFGPATCIRAFITTALMLLATLAAAQQCTYEIEPNETPAEATLIRPPDSSGTFNADGARMPIICLAGEISGSNQDAFWWDVDELAAEHNWTVSIDGVRGLNQMSLYRIEFAENGVDVTAADELMRFATPNGSPHVSKTFLIEPGRYLVGLSVAGAEGPYVVNLTPESNSRRANSFARSTYRGEFRVYGSVEDVRELTFEVSADDAGFTWGLELRSAIGTSPRLELEGPDGPIGEPTTVTDGVARYDGYALAPGTYTVRVVGSTGTAIVSLSKQGRQGQGQEVEPNNSPQDATLFPLGSDMRGRSGDLDWFRTDVSEQDATQGWDLQVEAGAEVDVLLQHPDGHQLLSRRFTEGSVERLNLQPGAYYLNVRRVREEADYRLTWVRAAAAPANVNEVEPNDTLATATDLGSKAEARGELHPQDIDFYRFQVEGQAQLYRVQVAGQGVTRLNVYSGGGNLISRVDGKGRLRLDDLLLLPGAQYMSVEGEGEYALRAMALGPAPAPQPPADMPASDESLSAAAAGPSEPAADEPVTGPPVVEDPILPPPPPGILEYEPNDDRSRAHRLQPAAVHVGRISSPNDEDHYRFHLSADQYVRLELVPPEGDSLSFDLLGEGRFRPLPGEAGQPVVMERWLLAGDHTLFVHNRPAGGGTGGYYQLRLTPLGALHLPVDREPNDTPATAATMPAELEWTGSLGEVGDVDVYAIPQFAEDTEMQVTLSGVERANVVLRLAEGRGSVSRGENDVFTMTVPGGQRTYLELSGAGRYRIEVAFSRQPDPSQLLPPRTSGALSISLDTPVEELAAFWHEGQRLEATATVRNDSEEPQTVNLSAAVNDVRSEVNVPASIELRAGESVQVPVTLEVPAGAREDVPLNLQVAASSAVGSAAANRHLLLRCEAEPVAPFPYHSLPRTLLGRPNVLWSGLGATVHGASPHMQRDLALIDGRTAISFGGYLAADHSPTYALAGEAPVSLVGTSLHPQAGGDGGTQLRRFRIETSLDGASFTPAFEGILQAARVEQSFEFDEPVTARYARLVMVDSVSDSTSRAYAGEWKLYAEDPALFSGLDIASPALGGHMVWSEPRLGSRSDSVVEPERRTSAVDVRPVEALTFVIGFRDARAALIEELRWLESEGGMTTPDRTVGTVIVEASLAGAAGPWEPVAEWPLQRDAAGTARLQLEEPVWARYLRFTAPKGAAEFLYPPQQLSVFEADVGEGGYLSAVSEWGNMTSSGPYELLVGDAEAVIGHESAGNHTREAAVTLVPGVVAAGSVAIGENVDWYKITVPQDQNHVQLQLRGDPTIAYLYEVTDASGKQVPYEERATGEGRTLTFFAEPGDYYLKLEEPKRSVVFSWDTSGSVAPYIPITYNSLAEFGRGVDGEREAVQLLAFHEPQPTWLLPYWSSDPLRVQRSIQEYDRSDNSSNTEIALITATKALADREGTRAILLITDAESNGYGLTPDLWRALEEVRPRVFTFEISSGGSDYAQDMMQDYAAVNGGYYEMADGVGDFDAGFARASCILRRPKAYEVEVAASYVAPPGPGMLSVVPAPGAAMAAVEVIFDASGSMGQLLPSGEQRIVAAKRALETLVGEVLPEETPFALRAFGHISPTSCETRLDVAFGALDRGKAMAAVQAIEPKLLSGTPIAQSLAAVAQDLADAGGGRQVILITDGEESCGGDPAAAVRELREAGPLSLAIVSLALEPEALAVFEALAEEVGASYVDVGSYEALNTAIAEALNPAFEVYDLEGELVAEGRVGGDAVELPMGLYRVRVLSMPVEVIENVRVPGDGSITVNAGR